MLKNTVSLTDFDIKDGFSINGSHIQLDNIFNQNSDFTIFMSFLHDTSFKDTDYFLRLGYESNLGPLVYVGEKDFTLRAFTTSGNITYHWDYKETILSTYRNKHLFLWFCKQGNRYKAIICQGGHIDRTVSIHNFQANRILINIPYKVQRIGFSENFYNLYDKEFHKISFLEKANGTFFYLIY